MSPASTPEEFAENDFDYHRANTVGLKETSGRSLFLKLVSTFDPTLSLGSKKFACLMSHFGLELLSVRKLIATLLAGMFR